MRLSHAHRLRKTREPDPLGQVCRGTSAQARSTRWRVLHAECRMRRRCGGAVISTADESHICSNGIYRGEAKVGCRIGRRGLFREVPRRFGRHGGRSRLRAMYRDSAARIVRIVGTGSDTSMRRIRSLSSSRQDESGQGDRVHQVPRPLLKGSRRRSGRLPKTLSTRYVVRTRSATWQGVQAVQRQFHQAIRASVTYSG